MKVLHLSTFDTAGGAARAAYRIHRGLHCLGLDSQMLVRNKSSNDKAVITQSSTFSKGIARVRADLNTLALRPYPRTSRSGFSSQWFPDGIASCVAQIAPDIINLHWVSNGYLQIETLAKFKGPIVWTLMDMWPFTGGCHYTQGCDRYINSCGACPQLNSSKVQDLSRQVWQRKSKVWKDINLTIVSPTSWLARCASSSALLKDRKIEVIPFCLDTETFKPFNKAFAREVFNLPKDKKIVLFGAIEATKDRRKGFHLLQPALQKLGRLDWKHKVELVVFGSSKPEREINLGFKVHYLGKIQDDALLALAYSAADVMIVPSMQEAFGQTASESIACGTPVVAFKETGLQDIVDHQQNGYLAIPFEAESLADGITWILESPNRHQKLGQKAREKAVQLFHLDRQAKQYASLYERIL